MTAAQHRHIRSSLIGIAGAALALLLPATAHAATASCADMAKIELPHIEIAGAADVDGGLATIDALDAGAKTLPAVAAAEKLPAFCRVKAILTPVPGSHIGVELWMPAKWNGKLLGLGNHGFAGEYERGYMAMGLGRGYAVVTTDTGHSSRVAETQTSFDTGRAVAGGFNIGNAAFAVGNRVAVEDFAWRAIHEMTAAAKLLVQRHYGVAARRAYFDGCSTGGRQAMREVQQFPADYDGVIAGGAPMNWTRIMASGMHYYLSGLLPSGAKMTQAKLDLAQKSAIASCDKLDGAADGLIAAPALCRWDPKLIACQPGANPAACLTGEEIAAIEAVERKLVYSKTGEALYAPLAPGGESFWVLMTAFNPVTAGHYRYLEGQGANWTPDRSTDLWPLLAQSEQPGAPGMAIVNISPDLSAFRAHGGKLIQYHGWNDQAMAPAFYPEYYAEVVDLQPGKDKLAQTQSFYRLFMIPGMTHCSGGMGPVNIGALNHAPAPVRDADHDVLEALDRWVEKNVAPAQIVGTQYAPDKSIARQMPVCAWPKVALYRGGDINSAASFACQSPPS